MKNKFATIAIILLALTQVKMLADEDFSLSGDDLGLVTPVTHEGYTSSPTNRPVFVAYYEIVPPWPLEFTCTVSFNQTIPDGLGMVGGQSPHGVDGTYIGLTKPIKGFTTGGGIVTLTVGYQNCKTGQSIESKNTIRIVFYDPAFYGKYGGIFRSFHSPEYQPPGPPSPFTPLGMDYGTVRTPVNAPASHYQYRTKTATMGVRG